jgi:Tol biopolymer transport system component
MNRRLALVSALAFPLATAAGCGGGGGGGGFLPGGIAATDAVVITDTPIATGTERLWLADPNGGGAVQVTNLPVGDGISLGDVLWSPDHTHVGVLSDPDGVTDLLLYVVDAATGDVVPVSGFQPANSYVEDFRWSPDGTKLAFRRNLPGDLHSLSVVSRDGTGLQDVSGDFPGGAEGVQIYGWSPDSTRLAIYSDRETALTGEVFVVGADGSGNVKVSGAPAFAGFHVQELEWSPAGDRVAFRGDLDVVSTYELYVALATGAGGRTRVHPALPAERDVFDFVWAPNGSRIAYASDQDVDGQAEVFSSLPDGTGNVQVSDALVSGGTVRATGACAWAPDSSRIAYVASQDTVGVFELYTALPYGAGASVKVSGPMTTGGDVPGIDSVAWSPDSSRIAYSADQDTDGLEEVYVTLPTSATVVKVSTATLTLGSVFRSAVWSPDSLHIAYMANHQGPSNAFVASTAPASAVGVDPTAANDNVVFGDWTRDGTRFVYGIQVGTDPEFDVAHAARADGLDDDVLTPLFDSGALDDLVAR